MNIFKIVGLILILAMAVFSYYLLRSVSDIDKCRDAGGSWDKEIQNCNLSNKSVNDNYLSSMNISHLTINIPEVEATAVVNKMSSLQGVDYAKGDYVVDPASEGIEKGSVYFDSHKITIISKVNAKKLLSYYASPFFVSNQGSGVFYYVGLFSYDEKLNKSTHLDSAFLGDRVANIQISDAIQAIDVSYLIHGENQSFADQPKQRKSLRLDVAAENPSFMNKKMHPSWDKNADGLNDCEDDGTCDHTVDYSQPRMD